MQEMAHHASIDRTARDLFALVGARQFTKRKARRLVAIAPEDLPPEARALLTDMAPVLSLCRRGKYAEALAELHRVGRDALAPQKLALQRGPASPTSREPVTFVTIATIVGFVASVVSLAVFLKDVIERLSAAGGTDKIGTLGDAQQLFDSRNVEISSVVSDCTILDVGDPIVVLVRHVAKGARLTVAANHGTIYVSKVEGELVVASNDDTIQVEENTGTVLVQNNDDTIHILSSSGHVGIAGNSDTIGVLVNEGELLVAGNDDTIAVGENTGRAKITANADSIGFKSNAGGTITVEGNAGGITDDADISVADNTGGVIVANGNDGNINVGRKNGALTGTIRKGVRPGDIQGID